MAEDWKGFNLFSGVELRYHVDEVLFGGRTRYQQVDVIRTFAFGKLLMLDGDPQSSEADEYIYHETLVHPALVTHPEPRRVFIAGGGEGATLREVLRHPSVERVVMVDIDAELVDLCRRLLVSWHQGVFDDQRAEVRHEDALAYLAATEERFDVMVLDLTAPVPAGPSVGLYGLDFYRSVRERLAPGGVIGLQAQSGSPNQLEWHARIVATFRSLLPIVRSYQAYVPSFAEPWGFAIASESRDPLALSVAEIDRTLAARGLNGLRFYDGQTHQALFSLPLSVRSTLEILLAAQL